jgi:hypothetical protein
VKYYILRTTSKLILSGIRKNCLNSERSLLLYHFTRRVIKLTVVIIRDITVIPYSSLKAKSIHR